MTSLKQEPAKRLAAAEVMQQIPPSCRCIFIPIPTTCSKNPLLMPWTGRKPRLHLSALFLAGGLMVYMSCFPQESCVSCFGAGREGEAMKFSLAGVLSPCCEPAHHGAEHPPHGPAAQAPLQKHQGQQQSWEKNAVRSFGGILILSEQTLTSFSLNFLHISGTTSVHRSKGMNYILSKKPRPVGSYLT